MKIRRFDIEDDGIFGLNEYECKDGTYCAAEEVQKLVDKLVNALEEIREHPCGEGNDSYGMFNIATEVLDEISRTK